MDPMHNYDTFAEIVSSYPLEILCFCHEIKVSNFGIAGKIVSFFS